MLIDNDKSPMSLWHDSVKASHSLAKLSSPRTQIICQMTPEETGLLIIDAQKRFCDPLTSKRGSRKAEAVCDRINRLAPIFRAAGYKIFAVYYDARDNTDNPDFHIFKPAETDTLFKKYTDSAFFGGELKEILLQQGIKNVLTCGFNFNACVLRTARDALHCGFNTAVIEDMSGNDRANDGLWQEDLDDYGRAGIPVLKTAQIVRL